MHRVGVLPCHAAIVQKRHLQTKKLYGKAYPRVHGLVYSVSDGILKKLDTDEADMYRKYSSVYGLFGVPTPPAKVKAEGMESNTCELNTTEACTCVHTH